jgi:hypothetical protein
MSSGLSRGTIEAITHYKTSVEETHGRAFMIGAVSAAALMFSTDSFAQQARPGRPKTLGHADKHDRYNESRQTSTIAMINKGKAGSYKAISIRSVSRPATARSLPLPSRSRDLLGQISGR